uniref:Peptidase S1 domain-containing protein n=1 Tax=Anopheles culicifacies TaxID=139723 RepID=A0A182MDH9_9DIPT
MKLWLIWFYFSVACSCYCEHLDSTPNDLSYEEIFNQEEETFSGACTEDVPPSNPFPTADDIEDLFPPTMSLDEDVTVEENSTQIPQEIGIMMQTTTEEGWYAEGKESKLKIEVTPYSALLYQEDEFGLEFLCPGYWLEKDVLLIRRDCWPMDVTLNMEESVAEVFLENDLNLMVLRLFPNLTGEQEELHLAHISDSFPVSTNDCKLYVLQEHYAQFETYSWAMKPLPFKRARGLCRENHICLRTRRSAMYGVDYALLCGQSLTGMLITDRTKYERVFGKITLMDLSLAKLWIDEILKEINGSIETQEVTTFLSLSLTPMPPAEMYGEEDDTI